MWDEVKPITLFLTQKNTDDSWFQLHFYSHDYELIKLREAVHYDEKKCVLGSYSRLLDAHCESKYDSNYFVGRLSYETTRKMIEYYENPNLFVEYMF